MTQSYLKQKLIQGLQERGYTLGDRLSKSEYGGPSGAIVFRGEREGEPVALKIASYGFLNSFEDDSVEKLEEFRRREKEVLQLAGNHPNIPHYIDSFTIDGDEHSEPIYVLAMEYLNIPSIADRIKAGERVYEREAQILIRDGLSALNHLHTGLPYQVLHRDIKPSNVLLNGEKAYIFDFDIVKQGRDDTTSATSIDTIGYYPMDAFSGHQNPSQDLVALGNVSIAGILANEIGNVRYEQGKYGLESVRVDGLPVSAKIRNYLGKLTSAPEQRFQTAREAIIGLERILGTSLSPRIETQTQPNQPQISRQMSLLPTPTFSKFRSLKGKFGREFMERYNEKAKKYGNPQVLTVLKYKRMPTRGFLEGIVKGGNSFTGVLASEVLRGTGLRMATRPDLEEMFGKWFRLFFNYVDIGVALRTNGDSYKENDLPAKILYSDLNSRGIEVESGGGKLVSFNALSLEENPNSSYGLVFRLNNEATQDDILDLNAFRWNYSRNDGLSPACFVWDRSWFSGVGGLACSCGAGRVVAVSAKGTSQKNSGVDLVD